MTARIVFHDGIIQGGKYKVDRLIHHETEQSRQLLERDSNIETESRN